jgi:hypothetical protein
MGRDAEHVEIGSGLQRLAPPSQAIAASIFRELPFGLPDQHDPFIVRESRPATYRIRQGGETGRRGG